MLKRFILMVGFVLACGSAWAESDKWQPLKDKAQSIVKQVGKGKDFDQWEGSLDKFGIGIACQLPNMKDGIGCKQEALDTVDKELEKLKAAWPDISDETKTLMVTVLTIFANPMAEAMGCVVNTDKAVKDKPDSKLSLGVVQYKQDGKDILDKVLFKIEYILKNGYDQAITMIDATIHFSDPFGETISGIRVMKDFSIAAGEEGVASGSYRLDDRMEKIKPEHVKYKLKVNKLLFEDGSILSFED